MDSTDIDLAAVIRALTDVVTPAVDPDAAQAREQLRLSIDHLRFIALRIDHLHDRALFELKDHLQLAEAVLTALDRDSRRCAALTAAVTAGASVLPTVASTLIELRTASSALAAEISEVIRGLDDAGPDMRRAAIEAVVAGSVERVAFERSWYAPLGIDPDRDDLPSLQQVLDSTS